MRICQGSIEIAGQMGIVSGELKKRGHIATGYNKFQSYLGYKDHLINTTAKELEKQAEHIINFYDIFHFHYASSLKADYKDLPIIQSKGKKMFMHHWGNDIRFHDMARTSNPYVYTGDSPSNKTIHDRLTIISKYVDEAIVQDYEVLPYAAPYYKKVHVIPIAIDISRFIPHYPELRKKRPLILHAPTNPAFKGTVFIEDAIKQLKKKYDFEYRRIEKMSNTEVISLYKQADIIVDQILCGSHGLLSVESMALGKPVITYIRPDLQDSFPADLPIVNGNPDNVKEKIAMLLDSPEMRRELGIKGRIYAQQHHAKEVVTDKLVQLYNR